MYNVYIIYNAHADIHCTCTCTLYIHVWQQHLIVYENSRWGHDQEGIWKHATFALITGTPIMAEPNREVGGMGITYIIALPRTCVHVHVGNAPTGSHTCSVEDLNMAVM